MPDDIRSDVRDVAGNSYRSESLTPSRDRMTRMKMLRLIIVGVSVLVAVPRVALAVDDPYAAQLFAERCASCHEAAAAGAARIPTVAQLKAMTPTAILKALDSGIMRSQASALSANDRQAIANF